MTDDAPNFEGLADRECGDHRTVGPHRAWCHDCGEWCYPTSPCKGCELPALRGQVATLRAQHDELLVEVHRLRGVKEQWILAEQEIARLTILGNVAETMPGGDG